MWSKRIVSAVFYLAFCLSFGVGPLLVVWAARNLIVTSWADCFLICLIAGCIQLGLVVGIPKTWELAISRM